MSLTSYNPHVMVALGTTTIATSILSSSNATTIGTTTTSSVTDSNHSIGAWCDATNNDVWLLDYPVCTTRYDSVITFTLVCGVLAFITLFTIFGNVLVLVALYKYGTLRTMSNCLIGNLAISDFLLATTILPISICNDVLGYWVLGRMACTAWLLADVLYCTASVWGLCTVAFDRYMATVYPVWYHDQRSVEKAVICIVFVWIFSFIISFAPIIGWRHMIPSFFSFNSRMNSYECVLFMSSSYVIYSAVGSFIIPLCLMIFMYIRIFMVLHSKSQQIKQKAKRETGSNKSKHNKNGYPSILEPLNTPHECVVRDFTTTTLISLSGLELTEENDNDDSLMETDTLLVPTVTVNTESLHKISEDTNGKVTSYHSGETADNNIQHENHSSYLLNGTSNALTLETITCGNQKNIDEMPKPDEFSILKRRSKSVSVERSPLHSKSPSISFLNVSDLERRNSHEGTIHANSSESGDSHSVNNNSLFLNPVCRSKSANMLSSSDEDAVAKHSPRLPRRSLPCDLAKFGRNNRMTLSMKRRFELREQRATKRMLLIMACFIVCWMPFVGMYISRSLCSSCIMNTHLVSAIIWLGYVNSSLNPVLYTLFNDDFKMAFKKLLGCKSASRRRRVR